MTTVFDPPHKALSLNEALWNTSRAALLTAFVRWSTAHHAEHPYSIDVVFRDDVERLMMDIALALKNVPADHVAEWEERDHEGAIRFVSTWKVRDDNG